MGNDNRGSVRTGLSLLRIPAVQRAIGGALALVAGLVGYLLIRRPPAPAPKASLPVILPAGATYVALGDSYSAGEGLNVYEMGSGDFPGDDCHRSPLAYPRLIAEANDSVLVFHACSGAQTENVFDVVQRTAGGRSSNVYGIQANGIFERAPALVTLTMGGNDMEFSAVLKACGTRANDYCPLNVYTPEPGHGAATVLGTWSRYQIAAVRNRLRAIYQRLRAQTPPTTRILAIGYPHLFTDRIVGDQDCLTTYQRISKNERDWLNQIGDGLNGAIRLAAAEAGIEYVDVAWLFSGHEPCAAGGEWVSPLWLRLNGPDRGSFHPNKEGHAWIARIVSCYYKINAPPTTLRPIPPTPSPSVIPPSLPPVPLPPSAATQLCVKTG